jgi:hypothetical protein
MDMIPFPTHVPSIILGLAIYSGINVIFRNNETDPY